MANRGWNKVTEKVEEVAVEWPMTLFPGDTTLFIVLVGGKSYKFIAPNKY